MTGSCTLVEPPLDLVQIECAWCGRAVIMTAVAQADGSNVHRLRRAK